jgi:hypothetical protein
MTDDLTDVFNHLPVHVKCEAHEEGSPWECHLNIYGTGDNYSGNARVRIEFEKRLIESGETVTHGAFICRCTGGNYFVNLLAKTFTVLPGGEGEIGFDLRSMFPGLRMVEVVHKEPDPDLFVIPADLKPAEQT